MTVVMQGSGKAHPAGLGAIAQILPFGDTIAVPFSGDTAESGGRALFRAAPGLHTRTCQTTRSAYDAGHTHGPSLEGFSGAIAHDGDPRPSDFKNCNNIVPIIRSHGSLGKIESAPRKGATFRVTLPRSSEGQA